MSETDVRRRRYSRLGHYLNPLPRGEEDAQRQVRGSATDRGLKLEWSKGGHLGRRLDVPKMWLRSSRLVCFELFGVSFATADRGICWQSKSAGSFPSAPMSKGTEPCQTQGGRDRRV